MGFLNPANLLLGLSLAALIAIYLRSRSRPVIEVSSLILFEESPAPVARSRILRLDALFWLEAGALAALTLIWAGLYFRVTKPAVKLSHHALVFNLGAAMGARAGAGIRLDAAKRAALAIVNDAPPNFDFSIVSYAQEAKILNAATGRRDELRQTIDALKVQDVAVRPAALREALIDTRDSEQVELFTSQSPPAGLLAAPGESSKITVHPLTGASDNLAIVSLDPGVPKSSEGRCLLRNFSLKPRTCELRIESGGREIFHSTLIVEPRAQAMVRFGPLAQGGLVHAQILTPDGLDADNNHYALAPQISPARALVASPDNAARDDLARILLAINPAYQVTAIDPATISADKLTNQQFDLAVLHDYDGAGINAKARLFVFPEPSVSHAEPPPRLAVAGSVAMAELQSREGDAPLATPVLLGPARVITVPPWMDALASGKGVGASSTIPLAAAGRSSEGWIGFIAFDVRNHLLLDPDRLAALLLTIDTVKAITPLASLRVIPTGKIVQLATFKPATLISPAGARSSLIPDASGRVHFNPDEVGKYVVTGGAKPVEIYANYYDETESDLATMSSSPPITLKRSAERPVSQREIQAVTPSSILIALVAIMVLLQSVLLVRREQQRSLHHV